VTLTLNYVAIVYLVAVVLGTIISIICWVYPNNSKSSIRWLALSVFSLTYTLFVLFLSESRLIFNVPHLFHTNFITTLVYLPSSYFFVRTVILHQRMTWKDLIHAAPLLIFIVDYSVIYVQPAAEKILFMTSEKDFPYVLERGLFFPVSFQLPSRFLLFLVYLTIQFRMVLNSANPERRKILYYLSSQLILVFYYTISQFSIDALTLQLLSLLVAAYIVFIATALLFQPNILYGYEFSGNGALTDRPKKLNGTSHAEPSNGKKLEDLAERLDTFMNTQTPFLQHGYTINDLSAALQIPAYQLSAFLNHQMRVSFNEYLNRFRIMHSKKRITEGAAELLTLEALAFESGFSNRNSFTSAFKQFCGMTPSDFIRLQKNNSAHAKAS
jgi:AraC-like DNA-binding protein